MAGSGGRYARVIKFVREAEELARSGSLVLDDGEAAIYFLWGQPSHAFIRRDGVVVEGESALKAIAVHLGTPGTVDWNQGEVMQMDTLRCNSDELVEILQSIATASREPEGPQATQQQDQFSMPTESFVDAPPAFIATQEQSRPDEKLEGFPLMPKGDAIWSEVPTSVIHLDVLISALPTVLVTLDAPGVTAAGLVLRGELFDAVALAGSKMTGRQAWEYLLGVENGLVSAFEIPEDLAEALPILWRHRIVSSAIESRWFDLQAFTESQKGELQDRSLVIKSATGVGVAIFHRGRMAGSYTSSFPNAVADTEPLMPLIGPTLEGKVYILERLPQDEGSPFVVPKPVEAPLLEPLAAQVAPGMSMFAGITHPAPAMAGSASVSSGDGPRLTVLPGLSSEAGRGANPFAGLPDYAGLVSEMISIGEHHLGRDFRPIVPILQNCEHSPEGVRKAIMEVREYEIPSHPQERVVEAARAMQIFVADRISGT